jgi:hypothetical protein
MAANFISVDFGNADPDGAVRLSTVGTLRDLKNAGLQLKTGLVICLSDGEINAIGRVELRDGIWVAQIDKWFD